MTNNKFFSGSFVAVLGLLTSLSTGCGSAAEDNVPSTVTGSALTSVGLPSLTGTFVDEGHDLFNFYKLELKSDGTFTATNRCRPGFSPDECRVHVTHGTWQTTLVRWGEGAPPAALILTDSFNQVTKAYYHFDGVALALWSEVSDAPSVFVKQPSVDAPIGTFLSEGNDAFNFYRLELDSDGTFIAAGGCHANGKRDICEAITLIQGTWTTTFGPDVSGESRAQLVMTDSFNRVTKAFYQFDGRVLTLRSELSATPSEFVKQ